ncbi:MAG TPA: Ldh family oxidoreductase [Sphingomicrobium sp.]|nr:Ldh family oxidoreductase [Sphingomicrobium sp.]
MITDARSGPNLENERLVQGLALKKLSAEILNAAGLTTSDAELVADTLVQSDLWGHQSHGVLRLPAYVARIKSGAVNAAGKPLISLDRGPIAAIDGAGAMGQVVANTAMHLASVRAKEFGVSAISVRNSNHFGTAMYFTLSAARQGCLGFLATNASPAMPPWGGTRKAVGTNPWSWAAPAGKHPPMVLDIANTAVARGKIHLARQRAEPIPFGWALDENGRATTDPEAALRGVTLPMGGHKGYGIALMMDVLSGVLSGSAFGSGVAGPFQSEKPGQVGHFVIVLDIDAFIPLHEFENRQEELIASLKQNSLADGATEILYPGEREAILEAQNLAVGIKLPMETVKAIDILCDEFDLANPISS